MTYYHTQYINPWTFLSCRFLKMMIYFQKNGILVRPKQLELVKISDLTSEAPKLLLDYKWLDIEGVELLVLLEGECYIWYLQSSSLSSFKFHNITLFYPNLYLS